VTTNFLRYSIPELLHRVTLGELSFADLAGDVERAIAQYERDIHAWVCYDVEQARGGARFAEARRQAGEPLRLLEGIPFGAKDIFNTRMFPTEMGSKLWSGFTPGNNSRAVDSLLGEGAIAVGKTVTAEFAVHALNDTVNPHDARLTPGTSSSGSAAAVACGMVPFALGTQTAGSIVRPASFCGVWGMKPSFGLIPRTGVLKTTDSLDSIGFLAAHGASLRSLLDAIRVRGPDYPFVYRNVDRAGGAPKPPGRKWRVGVVRTHTWQGAATYARNAVDKLVTRLAAEADCEVAEVPWPEEMTVAHSTHSKIYVRSLAYYFQNEAKSYTEISPVMTQMIEDGRSVSNEEYRDALETQEAISETLDRLLKPFDMVVSLGTSTSAPPRHVTETPDPSLIWTLCHVPAVAVPYTRDPNGLPLGIQIVSRRWNDYLLLQGIEALVARELLPAGSLPIVRKD
jgi:Asp-tRNA(Asn)/Glu-tRNA(Gln) amidotransferase A subunit family amidase